MAAEGSFDWFDAIEDSPQMDSELEALTSPLTFPNKDRSTRSFSSHTQFEVGRAGPSSKTPAKPVMTSEEDSPSKSDQLDREERRRYLEQHDVLDFLTKVLMKTDTTGGKTGSCNEAMTFGDAIQLAEFDPDRTELEILQKEIAKVNETVDQLTEAIAALKEKKIKFLAEKVKRSKSKQDTVSKCEIFHQD